MLIINNSSKTLMTSPKYLPAIRQSRLYGHCEQSKGLRQTDRGNGDDK